MTYSWSASPSGGRGACLGIPEAETLGSSAGLRCPGRHCDVGDWGPPGVHGAAGAAKQAWGSGRAPAVGRGLPTPDLWMCLPQRVPEWDGPLQGSELT